MLTEYQGKIFNILNEYDLLREYAGYILNIGKRVWPIKRVCRILLLVNEYELYHHNQNSMFRREIWAAKPQTQKKTASKDKSPSEDLRKLTYSFPSSYSESWKWVKSKIGPRKVSIFRKRKRKLAQEKSAISRRPKNRRLCSSFSH